MRASVLPIIANDMLILKSSTAVAAVVMINGVAVGLVNSADDESNKIRVRYFKISPITSKSIIRVVDQRTNLDFNGSPFTVNPYPIRGKIKHVFGSFVFGSLYCTAIEDDIIPVVAFSDSESVAFGIARRDSSDSHHFSFAIRVPEIDGCGMPAFVHVAVVGAKSVLSGSPIRLKQKTRKPPLAARRLSRSVIRLAIKISAPSIRVAHEWGDYHYARSLKKSFEKLGCVVSVHTQDKWYGEDDVDVVLALRGRHRYKTDRRNVNLLWIISHPDRLADEEPGDYDHTFVASDIFFDTFNRRYRASSSVLHQATDPDVFRVDNSKEFASEVLFVGNSRSEFRTMVRWCLEKGINLTLWGNGWHGLVPPDLVRGVHIPNETLTKFYSNCKVLLNDHWDSMRESGFISNRLYDASAAGAVVISDPVAGLSEVFGDTILVARDAADLEDKVKFVINEPEAARNLASRAREIVINRHTFDVRARSILDTVENLFSTRAGSLSPPAALNNITVDAEG